MRAVNLFGIIWCAENMAEQTKIVYQTLTKYLERYERTLSHCLVKHQIFGWFYFAFICECFDIWLVRQTPLSHTL